MKHRRVRGCCGAASWSFSGARVLWCSIVVILFCLGAAFKEGEFCKCHQSKFCKDVRERAAAWARGEQGHQGIEVRDVKVSGEGRVTARLIPAGGEPLALELSAYKDGIVRIRVLEETMPRKRFEVPDVVLKDFEQRRLKLSRIEHKNDASFVQLNGHDVVIQHKPFQIEMLKEMEGDLSEQNSKLVRYVAAQSLEKFEHG